MQTEERQNIFTEKNNRYKVCRHKYKKAANQIEKRCKYVKKKYISPKVDVIKTRLGSKTLAGSNIGGGIDEGSSVKTHDLDLDDLIDESIWGDEIDGNN